MRAVENIKSRSRDRDDRSLLRSGTRSQNSRISSRSGDVNAADFSDDGSRDALYVRDVYCVDAPAKAASKSGYPGTPGTLGLLDAATQGRN